MPSNPNGKPNIILLTTGCANSTITMQQLAALGWHVGDVDPVYWENCEVCKINNAVMSDIGFDRQRAEKMLSKLPEPWVIKDPKLPHTLRHWESVLDPYKPLLLWITKDLDYVKASYKRRFNLPPELAEQRHKWCEQYFSRWPHAKLRLDAEQIAAAVSLFDPERTNKHATRRG